MRGPSRYSRALRPSVSVPACTSARPASADCTTWSTRLWTTRWTRRWPGYASEVEVTLLADGGVRVIDDGRGIPVDEHPVEKRPALEVVHDHAARGRQVRRQVLRGVRRPARRRHLRGERALHPRRHRGPQGRLPLDAELRARRAAGAGAPRRGDDRDRDHDHVLAGRRRSSRPPTGPSRRCPAGCRRRRSSTGGCASR